MTIDFFGEIKALVQNPIPNWPKLKKNEKVQAVFLASLPIVLGTFSYSFHEHNLSLKRFVIIAGSIFGISLSCAINMLAGVKKKD